MKTAKVWVKTRKVPYSIRHSVKDWLRRTTPTNIQLLIMGHGHGESGLAEGYGGDDLLDMQAKHLTAGLEASGGIDYPMPKSSQVSSETPGAWISGCGTDR